MKHDDIRIKKIVGKEKKRMRLGSVSRGGVTQTIRTDRYGEAQVFWYFKYL